MSDMNCNKGFTDSYMVLRHQDVKFFDLVKVLLYTNIQPRKFLHSRETKDDKSFERRWIIFISIVAQKFLQLVSKPLSCFGSAIETFLNLLSSNRNICYLLLNVLRGEVVWPDKTSATFLSIVGYLDKRVELDINIKPADDKYFAALSMMASKASYENAAYVQTIVQDHWKMKFLGFYDFWNDYQERATSRAIIFRETTECHDTVVVAFRGTDPFDADAWCSDFDISWYELPGVGNMHGGFMKCLGLQKSIGWPKEASESDNQPVKLAYYSIRETLREAMVDNDRTQFILTGHSKGGALAILFVAILALHEEKLLLHRLKGVFTFGQPRVGDEKFGNYMKKVLMENEIKYYRFVYGNDMVPRLPYDDKALMFKHFGTCLWFDRHYQAKVCQIDPSSYVRAHQTCLKASGGGCSKRLYSIVEDEPNKNYFSPLSMIPMMINAVFELIRSFRIYYTNGPSFSEGWFLRIFRIIGLAIPGVPAHLPQDYVNATRLASLDLFKS